MLVLWWVCCRCRVEEGKGAKEVAVRGSRGNVKKGMRMMEKVSGVVGDLRTYRKRGRRGSDQKQGGLKERIVMVNEVVLRKGRRQKKKSRTGGGVKDRDEELLTEVRKKGSRGGEGKRGDGL